MADTADVYPILKAQALKVAADRKSLKTYRVVLIGDSGIREALSSVADLQRRIGRRTHQRIQIVPLVAGGLTQLDAVDLCGVLRGHMRGQVILEVSPYWMSKGHDRELFDRVIDRIGFDSEDLADEFQRAGLPRPRWSSNFFLRNIRFMLSRTDAFMRGLRRYPPPPLHNPHRLQPGSQALARDEHRVFHACREIRERSPDYVGVYERMIQRLQDSGVQVTLLEAPLNPRLLTPHGEQSGLPPSIMKFYYHTRAALCADTNTHFWDLNRQSAFSSADFADAYHINRDSARARFTNALASHIAASVAVTGDIAQ